MHKIVLSFLGVMLLFSCKEKDTEAPEITNYKFSDASTEITLDTGATFQIQAVLTDNVNLKEVKLDIHNAFDGHGHKSIDWTEIIIHEISGTEYNFAQDVTIPGDAASGPYHVLLTVLDENGFESSPQTIFLTVNRADAPEVVIANPDFVAGYSVSKGSSFNVEGGIGDETDLSKIVIEVHSSDEEAALVYDEDFTLSGTSDISWDFQADGNVVIDIPADGASGTYELIVRVEDSDGNNTVKEFEFTVN